MTSYFVSRLAKVVGHRRARYARHAQRALCALALLCLALTSGRANAAPLTWSTLAEFRGTRDTVSQARSLRGLALAGDDSSIYGGFIQGSTSANLRQVSTSVASTSFNDTILNSVAMPNSLQPKGVATDDRGYVYSTLNNLNGSPVQQFRVYNATLGTTVATQSLTATAGNTQLGGMSVVKSGSSYYLYVTHNRGGAQLERWNVTNPAAPTLDTSFNGTGVLDLKVLTNNVNAYFNGVEVAADGTIYAAGGLLSTTIGDTVFKIAPSLTSFTATPVSGAMDVALFGGNVYATQYLSSNSAIAVLAQSSLSVTDTLLTGIAHPYAADTDNGYSGIDIGADGRIYVADQIYNVLAPSRTNYDRILISSALAVPEPASWLLAALGGTSMAVLHWRKRRSSKLPA